MTKKELIAALADVPDTYEVRLFANVYCPHAEDVRCCDHDGINIGHSKSFRRMNGAPWGSELKSIGRDDRGTAVLLETTVGR